MASAWAGRLPVNFNACSARLGAGGRAAAAASPSVLVSRSTDTQKIILFLIMTRPLYRPRQIKKPPSNGGMPSLLHIGLESQQKILAVDEKNKKIPIRFCLLLRLL